MKNNIFETGFDPNRPGAGSFQWQFLIWETNCK